METPPPSQEFSADTPLGKYAYRGAHLNTLATVATLLVAIAVGVVLYMHTQDARYAAESFVGAIKEQTAAVKDQTVAQREQNCLMRFDQRERSERAEFCRQIAR